VKGCCEYGNVLSSSVKCLDSRVAAQLAASQEGLSSVSK
jgi:hypothetical protein